MLAPAAAVVASGTDVVESGQLAAQVVELALESLLSAENVEFVVCGQGSHGTVTCFPAVAGGRVAGVQQADVVGGGIELRGVAGPAA